MPFAARLNSRIITHMVKISITVQFINKNQTSNLELAILSFFSLKRSFKDFFSALILY